jgi:hypothetical protein
VLEQLAAEKLERELREKLMAMTSMARGEENEREAGREREGNRAQLESRSRSRSRSWGAGQRAGDIWIAGLKGED